MPDNQDEIPTRGLPAAGGLTEHTTFAAGDLVAERYRIVRFIARGGMGEVYEAEDLTLRGRLALKTVRPEVAANPVSVERFKREISIARRITHPNVSRVYDVGVHRGETSVLFLTMEFLPGESLFERLTRSGAMSEAEALPIAEQIAAGLAAAHDAGIIHRDFKSANVMLVPAGTGVKAVITDFGLARLTASEEGMLTISDTGLVMGTPAYMAPEQVEGLRLTPAADIYAFGIVLYEMVTARRPFAGQTPMSSAIKRLTEAPVPPRQFVSTLDQAWNTAILRCLERRPEARFANALNVIAALKSRESATAVMPRHASESKRNWKPAAAVVVAVIALAALFTVPQLRRQKSEAPAAATQKPAVAMRRSVAVLGFRNNSDRAEAAWLSTAIGEMMSTELASGGKLRVALGADVARAKSDLAIADVEGIGREKLQQIARVLGVQSVVVGSYTLVGDSESRLLRIDARLLDANTGNVLASSTASGTEAGLFDLVSRAAGGVRQKLGLGSLSPAETVEAQATIPSNPLAVRLYNEGIAKLRLLDAEGARALLTQAKEADPKHPFIRSSLSAAYSALGHEADAAEEARRAVALSANLARDQKLQIESRLHEATKDWGKAIEAERSLWESYPDNIEYGLQLAEAQISGGKTNDALVTATALRRLPAPASNDGRIDLAEARAHEELGNFAMQRKLAAAAAAKARALGSRTLLARARIVEGGALMNLGDTRAANAALDESRSLYLAAGDRGNAARAIEMMAMLVGRGGDLTGERKLAEQALAIHREIGDAVSIARVLLNLGTVSTQEGRAADAERFNDEGLATFLQAGAKYPAAAAMNDIGAAAFYRGDLVAAQKRYEQALSLFSELGEKTGTATVLTNIGEVLLCRAEIGEARKMHEDSLAINRAIGDKAGIAYDLFRLGEIFMLRGELVAARDRYQEALRLQTEIGGKLGAADTRVALARVAIEEGKPADAEKSAREAEEILRTEGATDRSLLATAVVADALLAQRKVKEAFSTASAAWKTASQTEDRRIRYAVALTLARAKAASNDVASARKLLHDVRMEAVSKRFVLYDLEARLAWGEIEAAAGQPGGKKQLSTLEKEARSKGFGLIARRAAAGAG